MKKIISCLVLIFIIFLSSCSRTVTTTTTIGTDYSQSYCLYVATSSTGLFEDYFGIEDTKTKVFSDKESFDNFNNLINENFVSVNDKFNLDIDFNINDVAVTVIYCDNFIADINLSDIVFLEDEIDQQLTIENTGYDENESTYGFLYIVTTKNIDYEFSFSAIEFYTGNRYTDPWGGGYVTYKPIIYFYPTEEMTLTIEYVNESRLLTTYPKYNDGWTLYLNSDGTFKTQSSEREYYALYFDEVASYTCDFTEGFYVEKENAISFLEEKLAILGYTEREANEFIMYWLPVLEENEKSLVYFETTETREEECPLEFSTEPDSILRTIIHIKKVSEYTQITEQVLPTFDRFGFSIVEWGGITY